MMADDPNVLIRAVEQVVRTALAPVLVRLRTLEAAHATHVARVAAAAAGITPLLARLDALEARDAGGIETRLARSLATFAADLRDARLDPALVDDTLAWAAERHAEIPRAASRRGRDSGREHE